ncbi:hypothetical protein AX17_004050 [Amanita inopinata Kibby_2008]|nr:hypothetical protein AX17_004050 [Amanita inopinata Kibby_2008]
MAPPHLAAEEGTNSVADTTSTMLLLRANAQISEPTKRLVRGADPNKGRCLVENCDKSYAVQFSHCFPKRFEDDDRLLGNIEWHWDLEYSTLNLDTRYNIFCVGASFHRMYFLPTNSPLWMLLPEDSIIQQYHDAVHPSADGYYWVADRGSFPNIPDRADFKYRFLPMPGQMANIAIHRQHRVPDDGTPLTPNDFSTYMYPFDGFPLLTSHLHPRFVILEAGRRLNLLDAAVLLLFVTRHPILTQVSQIFSAWTCHRPATAMDDKSYNPDKDDDNRDDDFASSGVGSSRETDPHRYDSRKRRMQSGSPPPDSKRGRYEDKSHGHKHKQQKQSSSTRLSKKMLVEHNQQLGRAPWTRDAVKVWSKKCVPRKSTNSKPKNQNPVTAVIADSTNN